jgi:stalled ribosome rescue protein Dom34
MKEKACAVVWIDPKEVKIFWLQHSVVDRLVHYIRGGGANTRHGPHGVEKDYFQRIVEELPLVGPVLITGPVAGTAELMEFIGRTRPDISKRILGVEVIESPSDGDIEAIARKFSEG